MTRHSFGKLVFALTCASASLVSADDGTLHRVPAECVHGRFTVSFETPRGPIRLFTDTGGGNIVYEDSVRRLAMPVGRSSAGKQIARLPEAPRGLHLPLPAPDGCPDPGMLFVTPRERARPGAPDGVLGEAWFKNRLWLLDYPGRALYCLDGPLPIAAPSSHRMHFQTNREGQRTVNFPRVDIEVCGKKHPVLLDTGATLQLTDGAARAMRRKPGSAIATSFIVASLFDSWRSENPEWPVIENADATVEGQAAILVESIRVAGRRIGPLWFVRRPDGNFHEFMSQFMDTRIDGALGGNAFADFSLLLDYPASTFQLIPGSAARRLGQR